MNSCCRIISCALFALAGLTAGCSRGGFELQVLNKSDRELEEVRLEMGDLRVLVGVIQSGSGAGFSRVNSERVSRIVVEWKEGGEKFSRSGPFGELFRKSSWPFHGTLFIVVNPDRSLSLIPRKWSKGNKIEEYVQFRMELKEARDGKKFEPREPI